MKKVTFLNLKTCHMKFNNSVQSMIKSLIDFSPWFLIIGMFLLFSIPATLQAGYYDSIFTPKMGSVGTGLSAVIAIALVMVRMATGFSSAKLFVSGHEWLGVITVCVSLIVTYFEHIEASGIAAYFAEGDALVKSTLTSLIQAMVWAACGLEAILAMVLYSGKSTKGEVDISIDEEAGDQRRIEFEESVSQMNLRLDAINSLLMERA